MEEVADTVFESKNTIRIDLDVDDAETIKRIALKKGIPYMPLKFEWNPEKAKRNVEKHGVLFDEAATVFSDPLSMTFDDPEHSYGENRYIIIGLSAFGRLLFVSHTETDYKIRIISARQLTRKERKQYEKQYV